MKLCEVSYHFSVLKLLSRLLSRHFYENNIHAQNLEIFKADMTSMLADMLQSSLSNFSKLKVFLQYTCELMINIRIPLH